MLKTLAIVHADASAPKLDACLRRNLGGRPLLEWVLRRVGESQSVDGVVALLGESDQQRQAARRVPPDVPVYHTGQTDMLGGVVELLEEYPAEAIVLVRLDSPFVDPILIDRLIHTADEQQDLDYVTFRLCDGKPALRSSIGVVAEWIRTSAIKRADSEASDSPARQDATDYIQAHPESFRLRLIPAPAELDRDDLRLAVDDEEDWQRAQDFYEAVGSDECSWRQIVGLLDRNPHLSSQMAEQNRVAAGR